MEEFLIVR
jgi:hypothetical protein